jgi:hypothetical protein
MRTGLRRAGLVLLLVLGRTDRLRGVAAGRPLSWVAEHRGALQWAVVALGGIVLFAWDPPTARGADRRGTRDRRDRPHRGDRRAHSRSSRARLRSACSVRVCVTSAGKNDTRIPIPDST